MPKILVVDNSKDLLSLFQDIFKLDNIDVDCCNNALSMFDCLKNCIPDIMIIDVARTGIDQNMITQNLRKRKDLALVPIIITSPIKEQIQDYKSFGAYAALEKPFEINELRNTVRELMPILN